jgi:hypothetical protein
VGRTDHTQGAAAAAAASGGAARLFEVGGQTVVELGLSLGTAAASMQACKQPQAHLETEMLSASSPNSNSNNNSSMDQQL